MRFLYLLLILLLVACTADDSGMISDTNHTTTVENDNDAESDYTKAFEQANELQLFFKEDQSVASFIGEGNEFANFTETTQWLDEHTIQISIDNGGTTIYRLYKIEKDTVNLVYEDIQPPASDANSYQPIEEFMRLPIEVGTSFGGWTITETDMTLDTPLETFTGVIEVSNESPELISRRYYVQTFGLILQVDQMQTEDGMYEVRSTIDSLLFK